MDSLNSEDPAASYRAAANAWLVRFSPILDSPELLSAEAVNARIDEVRQLRKDAAPIRSGLASYGLASDSNLISTLGQAYLQLDSLESQLQARLTRASTPPPPPVDLEALNARLSALQPSPEVDETPTETIDEFETVQAAETPAEANLPTAAVKVSQDEAAEVLRALFLAALPKDVPIPLIPESPLPTDVPAGSLVLLTSPSTPSAGCGSLVFGFVCLSFTTFHMVIMVGGMWRAVGPAALLMLLFYSLFYIAGAAIWSQAFTALSTETITLDGFNLTVRRQLGTILREKTYQLGPASQAAVTNPWATAMASPSIAPTRRSQRIGGVVVSDANGRPIKIAAYAAPATQAQIAEQINTHLRL